MPDQTGIKRSWIMRDTLDTTAETGLQFFGKMTASISHEIKNVLAIINENAGLLEDIAGMAERGRAIEPQRLKTMSRAVVKQIRRADAIVQNMNRLAHSVDETFTNVDLNDTLVLIVALSDRLASTRGVTLAPKLQQESVKIRTAPYLLMNFIWLCLDFAIDAAGDEKIVELGIQETEIGAQIHIQRLAGLAGAPLEEFPAERERILLDLLGAELAIDTRNNEFVIKLAPAIDSG
jgi:signal transduction histidine kinase